MKPGLSIDIYGLSIEVGQGNHRAQRHTARWGLGANQGRGPLSSPKLQLKKKANQANTPLMHGVDGSL